MSPFPPPARGLASPLDSVLELTDAAGKQLAFNDDHDDKADALSTHHADSLVRVTLPGEGTYFLRLGDAQHQGGPEFAYRLRISPPRPDFALRVVPSCINAVSWRLTPITVFALRKDGFSGEIALSFRDDPEGVVLDGGLVPAGQDHVRVPWTTDRGEIQIELSDPPEGIVIDKVSWMDRTAAIVLHGDAGKAKPGLRGNLIANAFQKRTATNKEGKTREFRSFLSPLPAIPFEVVKP